MTRDISSLVEASSLSPLQGELDSTTIIFHQFNDGRLLRIIFLSENMWFVKDMSQDVVDLSTRRHCFDVDSLPRRYNFVVDSS